jgi:hybrid cluster-associated redox disulfide protein
MAKITKSTNLKELVTKHPETIEVLFNSGLHCAMCHLSSQETVEQAAEVHGVKVEKLLKDLNKVVAKKK